MAKNKKVVASTDDYTVFARRDGRYAVVGADGKAINGDDKVSILLQHELITAPPPKAPEPEPEPEPEAEAKADAVDGDAEEGEAETKDDKGEGE
ncbi:MAG: hypothetical protein AAF513_07035 [Pseudomonadota bacterium]